MYVRAISFSLLLSFIVLFGACQRNSQTKDKRLYVLTTTGMIQDIVRNIGGNHLKVMALMGPGVDPHLYKATASDTLKLSSANIIFYNGLHLEGKMVSILKKMQRTKAVYAVTDDIPRNLLRKPLHMHNAYDPHVWFDVSLWIRAAKKVQSALEKQDPLFAEDYRNNGRIYQRKLEKLHEWVFQQIASIKKKRRILVTAHDAFGYFGQAYHIKVVGLQGISTAAEYGVRDIERVVDMLVKNKIRAVFVESSVSKKSIEAVVQGCQSQGHSVKIGGSLFSDAMGAEGTPEGSYIGMVKHNVNCIVAALRNGKKS